MSSFTKLSAKKLFDEIVNSVAQPTATGFGSPAGRPSGNAYLKPMTLVEPRRDRLVTAGRCCMSGLLALGGMICNLPS
jgi:hypothetical protein